MANFKVGDKVLGISADIGEGQYIITEIHDENKQVLQCIEPNQFFDKGQIIDRNVDWSNCFTIIETKLGDKNMETTNNTTPVEFIRVERNTELFKKGEVFQYKSTYGFYEALNSGEAQISKNIYIESRVPVDVLTRLPKVFVPVTKFNPEYVTEAENERLQAVLKAKPVAKKSVKKTTKKD